MGGAGRRRARRAWSGLAAVASAIRSSARIVSIALASIDATTREAGLVGRAVGHRVARVDRQHRRRPGRGPWPARPSGCPHREAPAAGSRGRGRCRRSPRRSGAPTGSTSSSAGGCRPDRVRLAAAMPITPSAERHLGPDALGSYPWLAIVNRRPVLVEQQEHRVLVAERLGQAVDHGVHERVEVAAPADAGAQLGQPAAPPAPTPGGLGRADPSARWFDGIARCRRRGRRRRPAGGTRPACR